MFHQAGVCTASLHTGNVPDPLKAYRGKDCVKRFIDYIEAEAKRLHSLYPEQPMLPLDKGGVKIE